MNNIVWVDSYKEYDKNLYNAVKNKLEIIPVKRGPFGMKEKDRTEYDLDLGKSYIGVMVIDKVGDHNYYLLEFRRLRDNDYK